MPANAGSEAIDTLSNLGRRRRWYGRAKKKLIDELEDPREAATVLLLQIASYEGALTQMQIEAITEALIRDFQIPQNEAVELIAFSKMVLGQMNDAGDYLKTILAPIKKYCTDTEKNVFIVLLGDVAQLETPVNELQQSLLDNVKRHLLSH